MVALVPDAAHRVHLVAVGLSLSFRELRGMPRVRTRGRVVASVGSQHKERVGV